MRAFVSYDSWCLESYFSRYNGQFELCVDHKKAARVRSCFKLSSNSSFEIAFEKSGMQYALIGRYWCLMASRGGPARSTEPIWLLETPERMDLLNSLWAVRGLAWRLPRVVRLGNFFWILWKSAGVLSSLSGVKCFLEKNSGTLKPFWLESSRSELVRLSGRRLLMRIWGLKDFVEFSSPDFDSVS